MRIFYKAKKLKTSRPKCIFFIKPHVFPNPADFALRQGANFCQRQSQFTQVYAALFILSTCVLACVQTKISGWRGNFTNKSVSHSLSFTWNSVFRVHSFCSLLRTFEILLHAPSPFFLLRWPSLVCEGRQRAQFRVGFQ